MTWALVMTRPSSDRTMPVPAPSNTSPLPPTLVSIVTTDSSTWSRMDPDVHAPSGGGDGRAGLGPAGGVIVAVVAGEDDGRRAGTGEGTDDGGHERRRARGGTGAG